MSEQPENSRRTPSQGLWFTPSAGTTPPSPVEEPATRLPALPPEAPRERTTRGGWHLPAAEQTPFTPGQEIILTGPFYTLPEALFPEDSLNQLMTPSSTGNGHTIPAPEDTLLTQPAAPAPEDFITSVPAALAPAPEDSIPTTTSSPFSEPDRLPAPEDSIPTSTLDDLLTAQQAPAPEDSIPTGFTEPLRPDGVEAPSATVEDDDDVEEGIILRPDDDAASPVSPAETASALDDLTSFAMDEVKALEEEERRGNTEPLTPAEQALFRAADTATEMMPAASPAEPATTTPAEEDAAAYAARMADELMRQAQTAEASPSQAMTVPQDNFERTGQLADLNLYGENTGRLTNTRPMLSPEDEALAEKYRETQRQVAALREQYQRGQITYDDLQQRLRPLSVLDNNQVWWMLGFETDKWYRFDNLSQQWVEDTPPVPLTDDEVSGFGSEVRAGSMPYIPDAGASASGADFAAGNIGTPIPRPGQPLVDPNATMVGNAFNADYLNPEPEATYANPNIGGYGSIESGATIPSAATIPSPAVNAYPASATVTSPLPSDEVPTYDLDNAYTPQYDQARQVERNRTMQIVGLIAAGAAVLVLLCGVFSVVGLSAWADSKLEPYKVAIAELRTYSPPFQTVKIMDARGQLIAELNSQQGGARELVSLEEGDISPYLVHAILSVENSTFYNDAGYDPLRIAGAFWQNFTSGEVESGASTITQQIARNLILNDTTVSAERKIDELLVANKIAQDYSKNDILNLYLNQFYFGNQSYGVEAASQFYFGKSAKDVNMAEAAMLAGLIQSPAGNDPVVNREQAKAAMYNVIRLMLETGCIQFQHGEWAQSNQPFCIQDGTQVMDNGRQVRLVTVRSDGKYGGLLAVQLAQVETRPYLPRESRYKYPHFVNFIQSLVEQEFGPDAMFQRGFTIYTTLEPRIQDTAQSALSSQVKALVNNGVNTGAVMVVDPKTGAIRAMVGSPDFTNEEFAGQVDNTRTFQQPGSAIKPILYAAALEGAGGQYYTPSTILWDVPTAYQVNGQTYAPTDFDRQTRGPVPMRQALAASLNIPAVKTLEFIGLDRFQEMASRLQLRFVEGTTFGLPSALGANDVRLIDMMKAYSIFANNGTYAPLHAITRITEDANGTILDVPRAEAEAPSQKITPQVAYLMQNILSDDAARASQFGTNSLLTLARLGIPTQNVVAAKSGTSNDNRDLWTMGFTSNAVVGVWLGTYNNDPTVGTTSMTASQVWNTVMEAAISGRAPTPFSNPGGIVQGIICRDTGTIADNNCPNQAGDIYIQSQPPPPAGTGFVQIINVDSWTGKIANEWCPQNVVQQTFANISDPFAIDWLNRTPAGQSYKARIGLPNDLRPAPTQACGQGEQLPTVTLVNPTDNQTLTGEVTITGQVSAPNFAYYQLEYASAGAPEVFTPIGAAVNQQFPNNGSPLGTWDTRTVPNGSYILRLAVYSSTNGYIFRTARVNLNNIPPTPTPAPATPTLPAPIAPVFTPLPFDPQIAPGGPATATATLSGI
jgi:membrane peptidoglycan carboxypeptidase